MASAYGFDMLPGSQGAVFALSGAARRDRRQSVGRWEAELRKDASFVCVWSTVLNLNDPLSEVTDAAHELAQELLDIVAIEERISLLLVEPHDNLVWRTSRHGLKFELTSSITFSAEPAEPKFIVRNARGEIVPDPPYVPPQHHSAFRYFRYSQAAQNILDGYRNMFLALESLLDHITPKRVREGETDWLKRALDDAVKIKGLNLSAFTMVGGNTPVENFLDAHYSAVRCAAFHSKSSAGQTLRPGRLRDQDIVLQQLLAVQALVESLLKTEFNARLPQSGFFHAGFGHLLSTIAPVTALLVSVGECPTVEQLLAEDENVAEGKAVPVTFAGSNGDLTDEWLFVSDIKPKELPITKLGSLRLIARPNDHLFLSGIANRMNRTLINTDLDLDGTSKLVVRVRCVLRNVRSPRRGFSH